LLEVSRSMTEIKAITADQWLNVKSVISMTQGWLGTLKVLFQPGDMIVCQEEQSISPRHFSTLPLGDYLRDSCKYPVTTVAGFYHPVRVQANQWLHQIRFWAGVIVILAGFFVLEANLDTMAQGMAHLLLMAFIVVFEIGAVAAWYGISG
jgi:hypothetical protein